MNGGLFFHLYFASSRTAPVSWLFDEHKDRCKLCAVSFTFEKAHVTVSSTRSHTGQFAQILAFFGILWNGHWRRRELIRPRMRNTTSSRRHTNFRATANIFAKITREASIEGPRQNTKPDQSYFRHRQPPLLPCLITDGRKRPNRYLDRVTSIAKDRRKQHGQ